MMNQARLTLNETVPMDPALHCGSLSALSATAGGGPGALEARNQLLVFTRYTDVLAALRDQRLSSAQIGAFSERQPSGCR